MDVHDDGWFGDSVAPDYDDDVAERFAPDALGPEVEFLADLAAGQPALEFAIGTGRVALPLAERGIAVSGIELSEAMVRELRAKPGGADIPVTIGDMATTRIDGGFGLVYLVFNTIMNLLTQDEQVACFENAAAHLSPGGAFVVEVIVPQIRRLPPGVRFAPFHVAGDHVGIDEYDLVTQRSWSHHLRPDRPWARMPFRYVWPSELDLMARVAGMRLTERWADWHRSTFTAESTSHVSVWRTQR
ncbi:MAG: class I SAM-dependent methyltransferase [Planctomycetota bacterium]